MSSKFDKNKRQLLKEQSLQYLGGKKCNNCGTTTLPANCYDFHHKLGNKDATISQIIKRKNKLDQELKQELDKCEILCSNCHRTKHTTL